MSFPALIWLGLNSVAANATSTVAIWPGTVGSAWGYRRELAKAEVRFRILIVPFDRENNAGVMEPFRQLRRSLEPVQLEDVMIQKIATATLIGLALATAACNTVRGAAKDVNSVANCTENAINGSQHC